MPSMTWKNALLASRPWSRPSTSSSRPSRGFGGISRQRLAERPHWRAGGASWSKRSLPCAGRDPGASPLRCALSAALSVLSGG